MADDTEFGFDPLANDVDHPEDLDDLDVDLNALGQALDTTWGRSSTPLTHQNSVKFMLEGRMLIASYAAVVKFGSEREMIDTKHRYGDESVSSIKAHVDAVKKRYKSLAGKALKLKEQGTTDSFEIISVTFFNPCRTAYYRRKTVFELS